MQCVENAPVTFDNDNPEWIEVDFANAKSPSSHDRAGSGRHHRARVRRHHR